MILLNNIFKPTWLLCGLIWVGYGCVSTSSTSYTCLCPNECEGKSGIKCDYRMMGKYLNGGSKTPLQTGFLMSKNDLQKTIFNEGFSLKKGYSKPKILEKETAFEIIKILVTARKVEETIPEGAVTVYYDPPLGSIYFFVKGSRDDFGVEILSNGLSHRDEFYILDPDKMDKLIRVLELSDSDADKDPFADK